MGLYIRDDRVRDMAKRLAEAQHITVTEAVRQALEQQARGARSRSRGARAAHSGDLGAPRRDAACDFDDDDMYDELGNPK